MYTRRSFHISCKYLSSSSQSLFNLSQLSNNLSLNLSRKLKKHGGESKITIVPNSNSNSKSAKSNSISKSTAVGHLNYKRSSHPTSVPLAKLFSSRFPLSLKESIKDYSMRNNVLKFQSDLLSLLPFYPYMDKLGRSSEVIQTKLSDGNYLNEYVIYPQNYNPQNYQNYNHLIMVHGYGSGLGFFLKNFEEISKSSNWIIHSIDLLGYGCSSRPSFKPKQDNLSGVESWFHDSFEEWLNLRNLNNNSDKLLIMAHSMGAYLMATYGINKNPNFCKKILMISPGAVLKHRKQIFIPKYFAKLWEQNISPFSIVRNAGPLGSKLVSMWSSRRFAKLSLRESNLLHKYAYAIFQNKGSGEYMLNYLLAPGADARFPLIERGIHKLKCKMLWCYGKEDWMDPQGGKLSSNILNNLNNDNNFSKVIEIDDSGHHVYLDNYKKFNQLMIDEMKNF